MIINLNIAGGRDDRAETEGHRRINVYPGLSLQKRFPTRDETWDADQPVGKKLNSAITNIRIDEGVDQNVPSLGCLKRDGGTCTAYHAGSTRDGDSATHSRVNQRDQSVAVIRTRRRHLVERDRAAARLGEREQRASWIICAGTRRCERRHCDR